MDSLQTSTQAPRHIRVTATGWTFEGDFVQNGAQWLAVNGTGHESANGLDFAVVPTTESLCPIPSVTFPIPVNSPVPLPNNPIVKG